jgi:hypothetical protein
MNRLDPLDWALLIGVCLLGWFLAVYLKSKYKIQKRDFFMVSIFVSALASLLIAAYHVLRGLLSLTP